MTTNGPFIQNLLIGVTLTVIGCLITFSNAQAVLNGRKSMQWPTTQGQVHASRVETTTKDEKIMYRPVIEYTYTLDNRTYTASVVSFVGNVSYEHSYDAEEFISHYPEGKQVTVSYNPLNSVEAVLEPGTNGLNYAWLVLGGILLFVGWGLFAKCLSPIKLVFTVVKWLFFR